jgi:predicted DNA-binding transcriptional regulator YafY
MAISRVPRVIAQNSHSNDQAEKPVSIEVVAEHLGVSVGTVRRYRRECGLPHYYSSSKRLHFFLKDVNEWLKARPGISPTSTVQHRAASPQEAGRSIRPASTRKGKK